MALTRADKQKVIHNLLVVKERGHELEISLRFEGKAAEADQVSNKTAALSRKIDDLIGQVMIEWTGESRAIIDEIAKSNASLDATIGEIENNLKVAQNVVKAIGFIDDVVVIAAKIASKI